DRQALHKNAVWLCDRPPRRLRRLLPLCKGENRLSHVALCTRTRSVAAALLQRGESIVTLAKGQPRSGRGSLTHPVSIDFVCASQTQSSRPRARISFRPMVRIVAGSRDPMYFTKRVLATV